MGKVLLLWISGFSYFQKEMNRYMYIPKKVVIFHIPLKTPCKAN